MTDTLPHRPLARPGAAPVMLPAAAPASGPVVDRTSVGARAGTDLAAPTTVVTTPVTTPVLPVVPDTPARPVGPSASSAPRTPAPGRELPTGDITLEIRRGRLLVRFSGEIDTVLRQQFTRVLGATRAAREPVDVDLSEVTFFAAEGVRMLVLLQGAAGGPGVAEARTSPAVDRTLRLSGIDRYPFLP